MIIAGTDEVGRGPLAGPVVAAAVILPKVYDLPGLTDSKKLSEKKREHLCDLIKAQALCWALGEASVEEIDKLNILQASLLAMTRALEALQAKPDKILVDGTFAPNFKGGSKTVIETIIGGDAKIPEISAASIIAKVTRDALMIKLADVYPQYGFSSHKGYGTKKHLEAIREYGPCPLHRRSFEPIKQLVEI